MSRGAEKTRVPLLMRDRSFYHTFLILAGTLILEQAVVLSVNLADNLMIGSYNETALAAVAAVNQIVFVVQQVIYGVTNGVIVLSSQYWGKQQTAPIRRLVCLGLRLEAALSMLFFAVVSLWPAQCVGLFVTDAAIIAEGVRYLRVIRFTFPFFAVTTVLLGAMRSVETVSLALKVSVVSLVTNCVINYILIFGRFGAPELGVVGAAIGTLAARTLECGIVCVYVFCRDRKLQLRAAELGRSDPALRGDYFRTSVPIVLQAAMWGVLNAIQTAILGHMTASAVAAYSISSTAFLLLKVTSVGACTAASIMVGKQIGSGGKQLRTMVYTMQLLFVGLGAALGIVLFFLRIPLLRVYRISDETRYLANAFFLIQSVVLLTMSYQMPTNAGILRGGDITFHGPGQLVCYPILDLERIGIGLRGYIEALEEAVIRTVAEYGITAGRIAGASGVWIDPEGRRPRKICAIGVRSSRFITMHGFALNVSTDLGWFTRINPCGFTDRGVTSIASETGLLPPMQEVKRAVIEILGKVLQCEIAAVP